MGFSNMSYEAHKDFHSPLYQGCNGSTVELGREPAFRWQKWQQNRHVPKRSLSSCSNPPHPHFFSAIWSDWNYCWIWMINSLTERRCLLLCNFWNLLMYIRSYVRITCNQIRIHLPERACHKLVFLVWKGECHVTFRS